MPPRTVPSSAACERVQFSKKPHGDGGGIVRNPYSGCCESSGQSKRFWAIWALALACPAEDHEAVVRSLSLPYDTAPLFLGKREIT
jgi:hypothetical protein